jgi:A-kinase anchor protein 10
MAFKFLQVYIFFPFSLSLSILFLDSDARVNYKKLHRNLYDILNDRTTLTFFVQYLESKNNLALVKFWLDVETFKATSDSSSERTESRISNYDHIRRERRRKSESYDDCVSISTNASTSNFDETEEVQSNADDDVSSYERMTLSLTDDEKSKICEKNRKDVEVVVAKSDTKFDEKFQPTIIEDALKIYRKYLVTDSTYSIELPATLLAKLSLALCGSDTESEIDLNNLWQAFEDAQKLVFGVMEKEYLTDFLDSSFYHKYTVDILTSDTLCLEEILCSESALFYFMEFLEQDKDNCKLAYLEFWLSATNFRKQLDQSDHLDNSQLKMDALVIYEKYISLQATNFLNFSNAVRVKVEELICSSEPACFDVPVKIVETFLEKNCFKKFIKSQLFFNILSEVMSKIERPSSSGIVRRNSSFALKFPPKIKHRRSNSECFPEKKGISRTISAQNTLLAGLDYKRNSKNATDLQIDSRQLADPDLLWRRQNSMSKLSFGRVDAYGRFERDFEMPTQHTISTSRSFQLENGTIDITDPQSIFEQKWNSAQNRLKSVVRKLVHLPEDTVQQEIAWQVAELIVKDVTSITLHNENNININNSNS